MNNIETNFNIIAKNILSGNIDKGFWSEDDIKKIKKGDPLMISQKLLLIISEISEAYESLRSDGFNKVCDKEGLTISFFEEEMADVLIRLLDVCGAMDIDIDKAFKEKLEYNKKRTYKHSKKF